MRGGDLSAIARSRLPPHPNHLPPGEKESHRVDGRGQSEVRRTSDITGRTSDVVTIQSEVQRTSDIIGRTFDIIYFLFPIPSPYQLDMGARLR